MLARIRRSHLLMVSLAIVLVGLLLFQPCVRRAVFDPLVEGLRPFRYLLSFASHVQKWRAVVIVLSALLAVAAVRLVARMSWSTPPPEADLCEPIGRDPLEITVRLLDGADRSPLKRERIRRVLHELLERAMAAHRGITVEEARKLLSTGQAGMDSRVHAFLFSEEPEPKRRNRGIYHREIEHVLSVIEQMQ